MALKVEITLPHLQLCEQPSAWTTFEYELVDTNWGIQKVGVEPATRSAVATWMYMKKKKGRAKIGWFKLDVVVYDMHVADLCEDLTFRTVLLVHCIACTTFAVVHTLRGTCKVGLMFIQGHLRQWLVYAGWAMFWGRDQYWFGNETATRCSPTFCHTCKQTKQGDGNKQGSIP